MSQFVEGPRKTFIASETGGANLRWYMSDGSTSPPTVSLATATDPAIGVNEDAVLAVSDRVALRLTNSQGTVKMVAAAAITAGNKVYAAADGEVTSSGTLTEGIACEAAAADQDIIEVLNLMASAAAEYDDDELLALGSGADAVLLWSTGDADNHSLVVGLGDTNQALHVTDKAARATDWAVGADTHPTIYVHSNTTPATDYLKIGVHNGSNCWLGDVVGAGTAFIGFDGLEVLEFTETALAVNHVMISNAATGVGPSIAATGEANVDLLLTPAGTGDVNITIGHVTMGDGGTVTQLTNKSTGVTLNTESGQITMNGAALADDTTVEFTVTNSRVSAVDTIIANLASANTAGAYTLTVDAVGAGSFKLSLRNHSGGSLSEAVVINFAIVGGSSS